MFGAGFPTMFGAGLLTSPNEPTEGLAQQDLRSGRDGVWRPAPNAGDPRNSTRLSRSRPAVGDLLGERQLVLDFVGSPGAVGFADVIESNLIKLLPVRSRILAGDARLAEVAGRLADGSGD
jgi:hypothetical protein